MCSLAIRVARQHFHRGEILAVVQRELRAQDLRHVERLILLVAHVPAHEHIVDDALIDGGGAEAIARARLELEGRIRLVLLRVHSQLALQQLRIEVAVVGGRALQVALHLLVRRVVQPLPGTQRQVGGETREEQVLLARAGDVHVNVIHEHRLTGLDVHIHAPVAAAEVVQLRMAFRLVVAERLERGGHFALDAVVKALDGVRAQ